MPGWIGRGWRLAFLVVGCPGFHKPWFLLFRAHDTLRFQNWRPWRLKPTSLILDETSPMFQIVISKLHPNYLQHNIHICYTDIIISKLYVCYTTRPPEGCCFPPLSPTPQPWPPWRDPPSGSGRWRSSTSSGATRGTRGAAAPPCTWRPKWTDTLFFSLFNWKWGLNQLARHDVFDIICIYFFIIIYIYIYIHIIDQKINSTSKRYCGINLGVPPSATWLWSCRRQFLAAGVKV